ncbi:hypothetical protein ABZX40_07575 [Streptomyces sp. NPDC004610]|uniref:hypothetical protein n=1 Tax=unclassified Streptomyces TaxID=2593676 RepID=UPI0033A46ADF
MAETPPTAPAQAVPTGSGVIAQTPPTAPAQAAPSGTGPPPETAATLPGQEPATLSESGPPPNPPPTTPGHEPTTPTRTVRLLLRLDRAAHRRGFLPALAVFPLSDYVLPVLPNQMLLMGLSALHPRRWRVIALTFVGASVLGAFLVATAVHAAGPWLLDAVGAVAPGQAELREVAGQVERHGGWALAALALLPWTPRAAVVMCALAGIPPWTVALAVLAGRPLPVTLLALTGAKAPRLLRRSGRVDRVLREVEARRTGPA